MNLLICMVYTRTR